MSNLPSKVTFLTVSQCVAWSASCRYHGSFSCKESHPPIHRQGKCYTVMLGVLQKPLQHLIPLIIWETTRIVEKDVVKVIWKLFLLLQSHLLCCSSLELFSDGYSHDTANCLSSKRLRPLLYIVNIYRELLGKHVIEHNLKCQQYMCDSLLCAYLNYKQHCLFMKNAKLL